MSNSKALLLLALFFCTTSSGALALPCDQIAQPPKQSPEKLDTAEGLAFTNTAQYRKEFDQAVKEARAVCRKYVGQPNVAIVFDIDETLLDNRQEIERNQNFNMGQFGNWIKEGRAPTLKPTAKLLTWARSNGFPVFLISGRTESQRKGTIENLVRQKLAYDALLLRADNDDTPAEDFKSAQRHNLEKMGFKLIMNIGDQWSDLYGGHCLECFKLPNKMYYIP